MIRFYFLLFLYSAEALAMTIPDANIINQSKQFLKKTKAITIPDDIELNVDASLLSSTTINDSFIEPMKPDIKKPIPPENDIFKFDLNTNSKRNSIDDKRNEMFKLQHQINNLNSKFEKIEENYRELSQVFSGYLHGGKDSISHEQLYKIEKEALNWKQYIYNLKNKTNFNPTTIYPSASPSPTFSRSELDKTVSADIIKDLDKKISALRASKKNAKSKLKKKTTDFQNLLDQLKAWAK